MTKRRGRSEQPIPDPSAVLEAKVVGLTTNFRNVVKVRATLTSGACTRMAEAVLETESCARLFISEMRSRKVQGLDPLAGMDPVMSVVKQKDHTVVAYAPRFAVLAAG